MVKANASQTVGIIPVESIERRIRLIRRHKVMLDLDLAELCAVETRALVQAVKRNRDRFPGDFMFQLSKEELEHWRSQIVTANPSMKMGPRSKCALEVNFLIAKPFVRLRQGFCSGVGTARQKIYQAGQCETFPAVFVAPFQGA